MAKKRPYREIKTELDEIMEALQDPSTDIDQALDLHKKAQKLIAELEAYLGSVKQRAHKEG